MSTETARAHIEAHDVNHGPVDAGHGHDDVPHGSFRGYVTGFLLAAVLTAIPFWLVMGEVIPNKQVTAAIVLGLAIVQIVVHMIYFLHMNTKSEAGWTMLALIFTLIVVVITIAGSIWVMYHMNANMMPGMDMAGDMAGDMARSMSGGM